MLHMIETGENHFCLSRLLEPEGDKGKLEAHFAPGASNLRYVTDYSDNNLITVYFARIIVLCGAATLHLSYSKNSSDPPCFNSN